MISFAQLRRATAINTVGNCCFASTTAFTHSLSARNFSCCLSASFLAFRYSAHLLEVFMERIPVLELEIGE